MNKKNKVNEFISAGILMILTACGIHENKAPSSPETLPLSDSSAVTYQIVNERVMQPSCVECHNQSTHRGGIALDTYEDIKANLELVQNEITGGTMPPDGPLAAEQIQLITDWINNGAPEIASASPTPGPIPNGQVTSASPTPTLNPTATPIASATPNNNPHATPTPFITPTPTPDPNILVPTYASIRQLVFVAKCISCHRAGGSESRYPLDDYAKMMATKNLIVPGNPANSWVYSDIAGKYMPPRNANAVTAAELAIIQTWIQNGAPQ